MKGKIEIEFEYATYDQMMRAMHVMAQAVSDAHALIEVKRVIATSYDSNDKPFMTTEKSG